MTTITDVAQSVSGNASPVVTEVPTLASERLIELLRKREAEQQETLFRITSRLKVVFFIFIIFVVVVTAVGGLVLLGPKLMEQLSKMVPSASSTKSTVSDNIETSSPESMDVSSETIPPEHAAESRKSDASFSHYRPSSATSGTSLKNKQSYKKRPVSENDIRKNRDAKRQSDGTSHSDVRSESPVTTSDHYEKQVDLTAFYEPVGSSKKTYRRGRTRRGRRYTSSHAVDTLSVKEQTARIKEKIRLIKMLVRRYHGKIDQILDYNSSYYKVKMFIPPDQLRPFQKALSDEATSTTFTVQKEASTPEKTCLVFEFYTR